MNPLLENRFQIVREDVKTRESRLSGGKSRLSTRGGVFLIQRVEGLERAILSTFRVDEPRETDTRDYEMKADTPSFVNAVETLDVYI